MIFWLVSYPSSEVPVRLMTHFWQCVAFLFNSLLWTLQCAYTAFSTVSSISWNVMPSYTCTVVLWPFELVSILIADLDPSYSLLLLVRSFLFINFSKLMMMPRDSSFFWTISRVISFFRSSYSHVHCRPHCKEATFPAFGQSFVANN